MSRTEPNIIITGTPGVGKTSLAELVAQQTGLQHVRVNDVVKERGCHEGWDAELESWVVDEDKVRFLLLGRGGAEGAGMEEGWLAWERRREELGSLADPPPCLAPTGYPPWAPC